MNLYILCILWGEKAMLREMLGMVHGPNVEGVIQYICLLECFQLCARALELALNTA
jgi:hypothetical protein